MRTLFAAKLPAPLLFAAAVLLAPALPTARAQPDAAQEELSLIEQEPFDLLTVRDRKGKPITIRLLPVDLPGRLVPSNPDPEQKLRIRLESRPDQLAEIAWKDVIKLELYEQIVLAEAERLFREGQSEKAYEFLNFLYRNYPHTPGLEATRQLFLYFDAGRSFRKGRYDLALAVLEELYQQNRDFRLNEQSPALTQLMGRAIDEIAGQYVANAQFRSARKFLTRIAKTYGNQPGIDVAKWRAKLIELAEAKRAEARAQLAAGRGRAAHKAVRQMLDILPTIAGGRQLQQQIARAFPLITVGVAQPAVVSDPQRMDNWAARRVGRLTKQTLVQLAGQGVEGGQYVSPLGMFELSEDGTKLTFRLTRLGNWPPASPVDAYDLARKLLALADPRDETYRPAWGRLVASVQVADLQTVVVQLQHLHVLPEALLQIPLRPPGAGRDVEDGPYVTAERSETEISFVPNPQYYAADARQRPQIIEQHFADSRRAIRALLRNEIDVLDYVFPADVPRLQKDPTVAVQPYDLPTVHLLVPNSRNPYLANVTFRRALTYGIDRQLILAKLLLGGHELAGCRVLSGPFPASAPESEAVAYAYDDRIEVRPCERRLATTLVVLADRQVEAAAKQRGETPPKRSTLVLAHPAGEVPRIACQTIAQQLAACGIGIQLRELPPGVTDDPQGEFDLLYVEAAVWEPLVDARRLLGPAGIARSTSSYLGLALRRLDAATNWTEARRRLYELHAAVHEDLSVIPLWQLVNYFAHRKSLHGVGNRPVTLYQNVDAWEIVLSSAA